MATLSQYYQVTFQFLFTLSWTVLDIVLLIMDILLDFKVAMPTTISALPFTNSCIFSV